MNLLITYPYKPRVKCLKLDTDLLITELWLHAELNIETHKENQ